MYIHMSILDIMEGPRASSITCRRVHINPIFENLKYLKVSMKEILVTRRERINKSIKRLSK